MSRQWSTLNSNSVEIYYVRMNTAYSMVNQRDKRKHATGTIICILWCSIVTDIAGGLIEKLSSVTPLKVIFA